MFSDSLFVSGSKLGRVASAAIYFLVASAGIASAVRQDQQPRQTVQTGPIDEPRGAEKEPTGPAIAKGKQAITQINAKCSTTLSVSADALFKANRWTLNPDAVETMDVLGPLMAKAGKHPVRIDSFTDSDDQTVSEKRAITMRGWLVNHGYVAEGTPVEGFGKRNPVAPKPEDSDHPEGRQKNRRVDIVIDTCSKLR